MGRTLVAILTFTPPELTQARAVFECDHPVPGRPYYYTAFPGPRRQHAVLVMSAGRFNVIVRGSAGRVIDHFRPSFIITVGTGGSAAKAPADTGKRLEEREEGANRADLGDVVVGNFIHYDEFGKATDGELRTRYEPFEHPSHFLTGISDSLASDTTWHRFLEPKLGADISGDEDARREARITEGIDPPDPLPSGRPKVHLENILSSDIIWEDPYSSAQQALLNRYDKATAIDCESYGVARAVYEGRGQLLDAPDYNPHFLPIRGVSDIVDTPEAKELRPRWTPYAARAAAAFARAVTEDIFRLFNSSQELE